MSWPPPAVLTPVVDPAATPPVTETPPPPPGAVGNHADSQVAPVPGESPPPTPTPETPPPDPLAALQQAEAVKFFLEQQRAAGKPLVLDPKQVAGLQPEAQQVVAAMLYQQEQQAKQLETLQAQLLAKVQQAADDKLAASQERAGALEWTEGSALRAMLESLKQKPGEVIDPFTEAGARRAAQVEMAEQFGKMFQSLDADKAARLRQAEEAKALAAQQDKRAKAIAWAKQHERDLDNPEVFEGMKALMKRKTPEGGEVFTGIEIEEAYELVMARLKLKALQETDAAAVAKAQERLERARPGQKVIPETPGDYFKPGNELKLWEFYQRVPEAAKRDEERLRAQSRSF
jgi:hypothetical protein